MEHNVYYACGAEEALGDLARRGERVQLCYLVPPFWTGRDFGAYDDRFSSPNEYYDSMARILQGVKGALDENGSVFVHIDERVHAHLRLMMDEIFGERAFRNEIIWAYRSGGRARTHFSRKHDTILYYALSDKAFFDPLGDPLPRKLARCNHLRRGTDADGREYSAILSAGKEYRYYDDEGVAPSDVWDDIPHLQQRPGAHGLPHAEAGKAAAAGDPQRQPSGRRRAGRFFRLRHDAGGGAQARPAVHRCGSLSRSPAYHARAAEGNRRRVGGAVGATPPSLLVIAPPLHRGTKETTEYCLPCVLEGRAK